MHQHYSGINLGHRHLTQGQYQGNSLNLGGHRVHLGNSGYRPSYYHHNFYQGSWNQGGWNYGGYGGYGHYHRPVSWGLGGWGLGRIIYSSGYSNYYNPYYGSGIYSNLAAGAPVYNYSQPIPVATATAAPSAPSNQALQLFDSAREAFYNGQSDIALQHVDAAIKLTPDDAVLHEFRGVTLFTLGRYEEAAGVVHAVLAVGPGWDWATLRSLYRSVTVFENQLRTLENVRDQNPQRADVRFLLAYLYLSEGFPQSAEKQLTRVVALRPDDQLAAQLLSMLKGTAPATGGTNPGPLAPSATPTPINPPVIQPPATGTDAATPATPGSRVDPAAMVGTWSAARGDAKFDLVLNADGTFAWKFVEKDKTESFGGKYTVQGSLIVLERAEGGALVANIVPDGDKKFNFKLVGTDAGDKGLDFAK